MISSRKTINPSMQLQIIQDKIYELRSQKIMLDFDLAILYKVETRVLNQSVKRNLNRFPKDFMFQLTIREWNALQSQIVESKQKGNSSQFVMSSRKHRGASYLPFAFTEQGVAMLSAVLKSKKAVEVNIAIMRAFVFVRQYALSHKDLTVKLKELETTYNKQFKDVYEAINYLMQKDTVQKQQSQRKRIGYKK